METFYFIVTIVFLAAMLDLAQGCSCFRDSGFGICSSDFALRGTVLSVEGNGTLQEDLVYSVRIEETYQVKSNDTTVNSTIMVTTPGGTCGVDPLDEGLTYLISGLYDKDDNPSYSIDICNSVIKQYTNVDDEDDVGLPCSGSSITITSYLIVLGILPHHLLN